MKLLERASANLRNLLADSSVVFGADDSLQPWVREIDDCLRGPFDRDPPPPHFACDRCSCAGSGEKVDYKVVTDRLRGTWDALISKHRANRGH